RCSFTVLHLASFQNLLEIPLLPDKSSLSFLFLNICIPRNCLRSPRSVILYLFNSHCLASSIFSLLGENSRISSTNIRIIKSFNMYRLASSFDLISPFDHRYLFMTLNYANGDCRRLYSVLTS